MEKVEKKYSAFMNFLKTPTPTLIGIYCCNSYIVFPDQ